jgi:hypothetical protein
VRGAAGHPGQQGHPVTGRGVHGRRAGQGSRWRAGADACIFQQLRYLEPAREGFGQVRRNRLGYPAAIGLLDNPGLRSQAAIVPGDARAVG